MNAEAIEETREVLLEAIRNKAETGGNATTMELLARAFAMTASARAADPESTIHIW